MANGYKGLYSEINFDNNLISDTLDKLHELDMQCGIEGKEIPKQIKKLESLLQDLWASNQKILIDSLKGA